MKKKYQRLYNELYYRIWFRPTQTTNQKMRGNEHAMNNKELAEMRTREVIKMFTLRNVLIVIFYKLFSRPKNDRL